MDTRLIYPCVCVCKSVYVYNRVTRMLGGTDSIPTHALL